MFYCNVVKRASLSNFYGKYYQILASNILEKFQTGVGNFTLCHHDLVSKVEVLIISEWLRGIRKCLGLKSLPVFTLFGTDIYDPQRSTVITGSLRKLNGKLEWFNNNMFHHSSVGVGSSLSRFLWHYDKSWGFTSLPGKFKTYVPSFFHRCQQHVFMKQLTGIRNHRCMV